MEGAIMAPGNNTRLKSRMRNNSGRSTISRLLSTRNHAINNKNNRNGAVRSNSLRSNANQRHLSNFPKNLSGNQAVNNEAYINNITNGNGLDAHESKITCPGNFTREVFNAICPRLGHTLHIPEDAVQALFNDMHLYPSKSQVSEMLQCARQCGRRNGASKFITFGEFCVFVREMQNQRPKQHRKQIHHCKSNSKCVSGCEVFLGGSCNPTTWRADTAIPELKKHGITFYNPQVSMWVPELVAQEHDAKQAASVLLYVVDSQTRSTVGMIEVAYLVSSGRCVVLVAQPYRPGQSIMGEVITQREYRDLVEGQTTLLMLVKTKGIKVHSSLPNALQCTANILRNSTNNMTPEEQVTSKLRRLREVFDSYGGQTGEINAYKLLDAFQELTQRELKINELYEYVNSSNENIANMSISFERFCMLMAEFTTDNCDTCSTNVWASQSLQRQCSTNNNSCNIDNSHLNQLIEEPFNRNSTIRQKPHFDVFLGGTCNSQNHWRKDIAIPILKKHGITYYNPTVRETNGYEVLDNECMLDNDNSTVNNRNLTDRDTLEWKQAMDRSKVLLFVITNDTRSLTTMILASHYLGLGKNIILSIQSLEDDCVIANETLSTQAVKDYNRGRVYLADMAKRKQIPVFENITEAVQCVIDKCQDNS